MDRYSCVFVCENEKTIWQDASPEEIEANSPMEAAMFYKSKMVHHGRPMGPFIRAMHTQTQEAVTYKVKTPEEPKPRVKKKPSPDSAFLLSVRSATHYTTFRRLVQILYITTIVVTGIMFVATIGLLQGQSLTGKLILGELINATFILIVATVIKHALIILADMGDLMIARTQPEASKAEGSKKDSTVSS